MVSVDCGGVPRSLGSYPMGPSMEGAAAAGISLDKSPSRCHRNAGNRHQTEASWLAVKQRRNKAAGLTPSPGQPQQTKQTATKKETEVHTVISHQLALVYLLQTPRVTLYCGRHAVIYTQYQKQGARELDKIWFLTCGR